MLIRAIIIVITLSLLTAPLSVPPCSDFMFSFMLLMNVFTVQTYFQGNEADSCTLSLLTFISSGFPLAQDA